MRNKIKYSPDDRLSSWKSGLGGLEASKLVALHAGDACPLLELGGVG